MSSPQEELDRFAEKIKNKVEQWQESAQKEMGITTGVGSEPMFIGRAPWRKCLFNAGHIGLELRNNDIL